MNPVEMKKAREGALLRHMMSVEKRGALKRQNTRHSQPLGKMGRAFKKQKTIAEI